ncbi:MAG: hypothetical protein SGI77_00910 [Pirellulaceae bacterium]|nr:hypothetical protein [Pirellulaceae bacterium]
MVSFFVDQHNRCIPHSAFKGQTPDEMYFATGADVPEKLQAARVVARQARREANLKRTCSACRPEPAIVQIKPPPIPPNST